MNHPRRLVFFFLGVLTVLRLVMISQVGLFPDEAYYFMWSERMDWSFFSKGPGVAAAIWLSTHAFGVSEFGLRALSPLLGLGTGLVLWSLARRLYGESVAAWTVLMIQALPIFNVGSLVMTIDPLSIFFWAAALITCWCALERSPEFSWWWPGTGALIGLGFLSKYTNAMQLLSLVLLLAITPRYRLEFKRAGFYTLLAVFLACTIPVLIWNAQHDWVTLEHLAARGGLHGEWHFEPGQFLAFLGLHFGVYSPLIFGAMLVAIVWGWRAARHSFKARFLLAFALPLFAIYFWLALKRTGEANWTAPATLSLGVLAVALWHERAQTSVLARRFCVAALAVGLAMSLVTINPDVVRGFGIALGYDHDPGARMRGWRTTADEIERVRAEFEKDFGQPVFLIANEHEVAASLAFYIHDKRVEGPGHPPVYIPAQAYFEDQFSFWPRYDELIDLPPGEKSEDTIYTEEKGYNPFKGRTALYISDRAEQRPATSIQDSFERWEMIACIDQFRRGQPLRALTIFACYNYLDPGVR
jgi:hypothetical protein